MNFGGYAQQEGLVGRLSAVHTSILTHTLSMSSGLCNHSGFCANDSTPDRFILLFEEREKIVGKEHECAGTYLRKCVRVF